MYSTGIGVGGVGAGGVGAGGVGAGVFLFIRKTPKVIQATKSVIAMLIQIRLLRFYYFISFCYFIVYSD